MYYQEKWIDGKLMCRGTPTGEWREVSLSVYREKLLAKLSKSNGSQKE